MLSSDDHWKHQNNPMHGSYLQPCCQQMCDHCVGQPNTEGGKVWDDGVHSSSRIKETCRINDKTHCSCQICPSLHWRNYQWWIYNHRLIHEMQYRMREKRLVLLTRVSSVVCSLQTSRHLHVLTPLTWTCPQTYWTADGNTYNEWDQQIFQHYRAQTLMVGPTWAAWPLPPGGPVGCRWAGSRKPTRRLEPGIWDTFLSAHFPHLLLLFLLSLLNWASRKVIYYPSWYFYSWQAYLPHCKINTSSQFRGNSAL